MLTKLLLIASLTCSLLSPDYCGHKSNQTPTQVEIREQQGTGQGPRSSVSIPISACVISSTIYLTFSVDIGDIDVILEEASEGIILQTSVDTSTLSAIIPFNAAPGEYCITFTLPSGSVYQGNFDI
ncbi:MAG: DUF3244 domain-containing protein [Bacteroidales bacterium]|nr:DUF3244 domain-containing protein [Bacteroidales bacterium]